MYRYVKSSESKLNEAYHVSETSISIPNVSNLKNPRNLGIHLIEKYDDVDKFIQHRKYTKPVYVYKADLQELKCIRSFDIDDWTGMELARSLSDSNVLPLIDASLKLRKLREEHQDNLEKLAESIRSWLVKDLNVNCIKYNNTVEFEGPCLCVLDNSCFKSWELVEIRNKGQRNSSGSKESLSS